MIDLDAEMNSNSCPEVIPVSGLPLLIGPYHLGVAVPILGL
ncbi:MAG: hypothetical protein QXO86_01470 [Nitrososphaerota archaeon]